MRLFGQGELLGEAALQPQCRDLRREFDDQHRIGETTQRLRAVIAAGDDQERYARSEEHTSELQSQMRISYAVFCLKKKKQDTTTPSARQSGASLKNITKQHSKNKVNNVHQI